MTGMPCVGTVKTELVDGLVIPLDGEYVPCDEPGTHLVASGHGVREGAACEEHHQDWWNRTQYDAHHIGDWLAAEEQDN